MASSRCLLPRASAGGARGCHRRHRHHGEAPRRARPAAEAITGHGPGHGGGQDLEAHTRRWVHKGVHRPPGCLLQRRRTVGEDVTQQDTSGATGLHYEGYCEQREQPLGWLIAPRDKRRM